MAYKSFVFPDKFVTRSYTVPSGFSSLPNSSPEGSGEKSGIYQASETPNFHRRLRAGELLPAQEYYRDDIEWNGSISGTCYYDNLGGVTGYITMSRAGFPIVPTYSDYRDRISEAETGFNLTALKQKALSQTLPQLDALTTLAESHKTFSLISQSFLRFRRLDRFATNFAFNSRKRRRYLQSLLPSNYTKKQYALAAARVGRSTANAWLEWRYGWRLLGYDLNNVVDFYNEPIRSEFVEGQAGSQHSITYNTSAEIPLMHTVTDRVRIVTTTSWNDNVSVRARATGKLSAKAVNYLASPVATGWELIPFSFVADWFVSVGDALKAWIALSQAEYVLSIGYSWELKGKGVVSNSYVTNYQYTSPSAHGEATYKRSMRLRVPSGTPSLTPQIRVQLNSPKIADLAALLITAGRYK